MANDHCPTYVIPNCNPSQLDLIYTKHKHRIIEFGHFPAVGISNHQAVYIIYNILPNKKHRKEIQIRQFKKTNDEILIQYCENYDWLSFYESNCVDFKINSLYKFMYNFMNEFFPIVTINTKHTPVPWFNKTIGELMKKRKQAYDLWKLNRKGETSDLLYNDYRKINNMVKYEIKNSKKKCLIGNLMILNQLNRDGM